MTKPHYSKIAHGFVFAPKPVLLTFKFAISLYLMYKTGHGSKTYYRLKQAVCSYQQAISVSRSDSPKDKVI